MNSHVTVSLPDYIQCLPVQMMAQNNSCGVVTDLRIVHLCCPDEVRRLSGRLSARAEGDVSNVSKAGFHGESKMFDATSHSHLPAGGSCMMMWMHSLSTCSGKISNTSPVVVDMRRVGAVSVTWKSLISPSTRQTSLRTVLSMAATASDSWSFVRSQHRTYILITYLDQGGPGLLMRHIRLVGWFGRQAA
jgi:hypothetical protein